MFRLGTRGQEKCHSVFGLCGPREAVQSLNSLNDQIAHFMVNRPKALNDEDDGFLPSEKETLKKSMTLMRHLLMDAQPREKSTYTPEETCGDCQAAESASLAVDTAAETAVQALARGHDYTPPPPTHSTTPPPVIFITPEGLFTRLARALSLRSSNQGRFCASVIMAARSLDSCRFNMETVTCAVKGASPVLGLSDIVSQTATWDIPEE
ncbi:hypothetical protein SKAU_G00112620 [Synaphobranchus kaupii]|uniref:Uncharacterized protein n=1 Tax=Synaphobranchus kaupii TaxID=118154 RepID=A0A9Q1G1G5_SYNKA|nr:hypothetical protein SKAU_G00112620 [Synaphobranchus kaupii]